jgi:hypothetical protein
MTRLTGRWPKFQAWRRRLRYGLPTVLGLCPQGYFIPYRYAGLAPPPGGRPSYAPIEALFEASQGEFREWLGVLDGYRQMLTAIGDLPAPAPRWQQDWFPRLDGAMAYTMTRALAPRRIVEIGSGHSTRFYARAVADGGLNTVITAIDPAPRAALAGLDAVTLERRTLQQCGFEPFAGFEPGDILSIDSSHILMPGSDVDLLLNHVLPMLRAGAIVHFHDIFLPDDYPAQWAWRGYGEQLGVAALLSGGAWRPLFASHYAISRMAGTIADSIVASLPLVAGAHESSLWLEKEIVGLKKEKPDGSNMRCRD